MYRLVHEAKAHYIATSYKLALQSAWFNFSSALTFYKESCAAGGIEMHQDLILEYIKLQALVMATIAPHWSEYIWTEILGNKTSIQVARWPEVPAVDAGLTAQLEFVRNTASNVNSAEAAVVKRQAKGKTTTYDPKLPKKLTIFVRIIPDFAVARI